jgi:hypothetical protein
MFINFKLVHYALKEFVVHCQFVIPAFSPHHFVELDQIRDVPLDLNASMEDAVLFLRQLVQWELCHWADVQVSKLFF